MNEICVVHLIRARNGTQPFKEFLEAYRACSGGIEHDLLFVCKGFRREEDWAAHYRNEAGDIRHKVLFTGDWGFDLRSYGVAMRQEKYRYFCFLNSFSRPLDTHWLAKLSHHIRKPGVGLVGATGSWESMYSNLFVSGGPKSKSSFKERLWRFARVRLCRMFFAPFPNWHIRTNALMVSREIALRCWPRLVLTKRSAYLFENGKNNLTRRVLDMGLDVFVVGRDGRGYEKEEWPESKTYRIASQENLLVADTQTQKYEQADPALRDYLARLAWGSLAEKCPDSV